LHFGAIYRSPNSTLQNDPELNAVINYLNKNTQEVKSLLILNYSQINYSSWAIYDNALNSDSAKTKISCLRKHFLSQHVNKPTRFRAQHEPHVLILLLRTKILLMYYNTAVQSTWKKRSCTFKFRS